MPRTSPKLQVDPDTGETHVLEYVAAQDVGFAINPAEVEGQISGGVTQGIGWALFEGLVYDEQGQLLTSTLMGLRPPTQPQRTQHHASSRASTLRPSDPSARKALANHPSYPLPPPSPTPSTTPSAPASPHLPITPERLFEAMHKM